MQWWYYRGQVTTPIDIPGKGPTVIRPRDKFQAPFSAVANLKRLGRVVACRPPKEAVQEKPEPKSPPKPPKATEERAVPAPTVVASDSEPQAEVVEEEEKVEATVTDVTDKNPKALELQEKEAPKDTPKASRRRRK